MSIAVWQLSVGMNSTQICKISQRNSERLLTDRQIILEDSFFLPHPLYRQVCKVIDRTSSTPTQSHTHARARAYSSAVEHSSSSSTSIVRDLYQQTTEVSIQQYEELRTIARKRWKTSSHWNIIVPTGSRTAALKCITLISISVSVHMKSETIRISYTSSAVAEMILFNRFQAIRIPFQHYYINYLNVWYR